MAADTNQHMKYAEQTAKLDKRKYYVSLLLRNLMKIFWLFPVARNKVFCIASGGRYYFDSEKYICEHLLENYPGRFKIYFLLKNTDSASREGVKFIKPLTLGHFFHFCTAGVIVANGGMPAYLPKKKSQYLINTWHGGGAYKSSYGSYKDDPDSFKYRALISKYKNKCINVFVSSCKTFSELVVPDLTNGYTGEIMPCGMPRNDLLYTPDKTAIRSKVCQAIGVDSDKFLILYAPTYRGAFYAFGSGGDVVHDWSLDTQQVCRAVKERFGKEPLFLFRKHPLDTSGDVAEAINVNTYPDMQELLCAVDMLITDYSSSIWDFSLMYKPCFLYVPDMEYYLNDDRGVYTPIETWPGIMAKTNEELNAAILGFDEETYRRKVDRHHQDLGSYETGTACRQVCERIVKVCGGR